MLRFLIFVSFADFLNYMPNSASGQKFGKKLEFFALFGMELKN